MPNQFLRGATTIGDATNRIVSALEQSGYSERSFYLAENGGVVLATRLERIDANGVPLTDSKRWMTGATFQERAGRNLAEFLTGLFYADPGYYRVILFVIGGEPFRSSERRATQIEVLEWLEQGLGRLPKSASELIFNSADGCVAIVYEFVSRDKAFEAGILRPGRFPARTHLEVSGVLALLSNAKFEAK